MEKLEITSPKYLLSIVKLKKDNLFVPKDTLGTVVWEYDGAYEVEFIVNNESVCLILKENEFTI